MQGGKTLQCLNLGARSMRMPFAEVLNGIGCLSQICNVELSRAYHRNGREIVESQGKAKKSIDTAMQSLLQSFTRLK